MNQKNPAIKRILADVKELQRHPSSRYHAVPLEDNMFEWHFTIRGPEDTAFAGGMYHGRILLPAEYPFKPPNIVFLTKNGRFEVGTKICLSISAYHEETWQPAWGVRTMLEAIISFLPTEGAGAIGALDWSADERKRLAKLSHSFTCSLCGPISKLLTEPTSAEEEARLAESAELKEQLAQLHLGPPPPSPSIGSTKHSFHDITGSPAKGLGDLVTDLHAIVASDVILEQSTLDMNSDGLDSAISEANHNNISSDSPLKLSEEFHEEFEGSNLAPTLEDREHAEITIDLTTGLRNRRAPAAGIAAEDNLAGNNNNANIPQVAVAANIANNRPAFLNHDRRQRLEDLLHTLILLTLIGLFAILFKVFMRNTFHLDL